MNNHGGAVIDDALGQKLPLEHGVLIFPVYDSYMNRQPLFSQRDIAGDLAEWLANNAIGHVRGGKDKGYRWYKDGKREKKVNSFTDFIAAGEFLAGTTRRCHQRTSCHRCILGRLERKAA